MKCPSCQGEVDADSIGGFPSARCEDCGGIWLTHGTLDQLAGAALEDQLREAWARPPQECRYCRAPLGFDPTCQRCQKQSTIPCPSGHGTMNTALVELHGHEVEIDQCTTCNGVWLDAQERELVQRPEGSATRIDSFLSESTRPPGKSWKLGKTSKRPSTELEKFMYALDNTHRQPLPSISVARVMVVILVFAFIAVRVFAWPYIQKMLE